MPNIINRGRAVAAIVTSAHREEILEMKRRNVSLRIEAAEKSNTKKLKKANGQEVE